MYNFFSHKSQLEPKILEKLKNINPKHIDGKCYWAAIEAAKVLSAADYEPVDIETMIDRDTDEIDETLAQYSNVPEEDLEGDDIDDKEQFIKIINELGTNQHLIMTAYEEGEHYYNIYKDHNNKTWLIDSDRNVYKEVKTTADLVHKLTAWGHTDENYDYFGLQFESELNDPENPIKYFLIAHKIDNETVKNSIKSEVEALNVSQAPGLESNSKIESVETATQTTQQNLRR